MRLPWRARGISGQPAPKIAEQTNQQPQQKQQQKPPDMSVYNQGSNSDYWDAYDNRLNGNVDIYGNAVSYPIGSPPPERPRQQARPGMAQPIQPQDQGTQYGNPSYSWDAWNNQAGIKDNPSYSWDAWNKQPSIQNNPSYNMAPPAAPAPAAPQGPYTYTAPGFMESGPYGGQMTYGGESDFGNFAYAPIDQRPQPFTAQYQGYDGSISDKPDFGRRDAFIQQVNDSMMPYYAGQKTGAPPSNFNDMWQKAGDMVKDGYQNPFAAPAVQMPSLEQYLAQYAPQQVYTSNNYYE